MTTPDSSFPIHFCKVAVSCKGFLLCALAALLLLAPGNLSAMDATERRLKVVFELSSGSDTAYELFVTKVEGFQRNFSGLADIAVVATSQGAGLFQAANNRFQPRLARLADRGVDFMVSTQGLEEIELDSSEILGFARTIRSSSKEIEKLQEQGWACVWDGESYVSDL